MTIAYNQNVDTFSSSNNRSNVVQYRHWFDYKDCEWKHAIDCVLSFTYEHKTYTYRDDDIYNIKITGAHHVDFWYRKNMDQNNAEETYIEITGYEHYFDENEQRGVHRLIKKDGTVLTFFEEYIGTLVITTEDF